MNFAAKTFLILNFGVALSALGQEPQGPVDKRAKRPAPSKEESAGQDVNKVSAATVERIMEQAVLNIANEYNLNEEQTKLTQELMKTRVRAFLEEHEAEVWPLIRELLSTQMGMNPPDDMERVKRIGKAAKPLAKLAQEAILDGNREWRKHLSPAQKAMHDFDMAEMEQVFEEINRRFDAWAEGHPPAGGLFPPPGNRQSRPPRPITPAPGLPGPSGEVLVVRDTFFDLYVKQFIVENELDPGQITSAHSILNEFKAKAKDFKNANKVELAQMAQELPAAKEARDREKLETLTESRTKLLTPVYQLFEEMEERLAALLTSTQLAKYKERNESVDPAKQREGIDEEILATPEPKAEAKSTPKTASTAPAKTKTESND